MLNRIVKTGNAKLLNLDLFIFNIDKNEIPEEEYSKLQLKDTPELRLFVNDRKE
jgi:hypothetical protein